MELLESRDPCGDVVRMNIERVGNGLPAIEEVPNDFFAKKKCRKEIRKYFQKPKARRDMSETMKKLRKMANVKSGVLDGPDVDIDEADLFDHIDRKEEPALHPSIVKKKRETARERRARLKKERAMNRRTNEKRKKESKKAREFSEWKHEDVEFEKVSYSVKLLDYEEKLRRRLKYNEKRIKQGRAPLPLPEKPKAPKSRSGGRNRIHPNKARKLAKRKEKRRIRAEKKEAALRRRKNKSSTKRERKSDELILAKSESGEYEPIRVFLDSDDEKNVYLSSDEEKLLNFYAETFPSVPSDYSEDEVKAEGYMEKILGDDYPGLSAPSFMRGLFDQYELGRFDIMKSIDLDWIGNKIPSEVKELFFPTLCFTYQLYRSRNVSDGIAACHQFGHIVFKEYNVSMLESSLSYIVDLYNMVRSESEAFDNFVSFFSRVINSDLILAIRSVLLTIVSFKWFPSDVSRSLMKYLGRPKKTSVLEMLSELMANIGHLLRSGELLLAGVPFTQILVSDSPASACITSISEHLFYSERLYTGLPVDGRMCQKYFVSHGEVLISTGEELLKKMIKVDPHYGRLKDLVVKLKEAVMDVKEAMASADRIPPLAISLEGHPGVGKSRLLNYLCTVWSVVKGRKFHEGMVYSRCTTSEYWDGYVPHSQPIVHYSEMGSQSKDIAVRNGDPILAEVVSLIDGKSKLLNMAFGDKGKVYAHPELIITDTNNHGFHAYALSCAPAAIMRRFLHISVSVMEKYRKPGTSQLDSAASLLAGGNLLDRYIFTVNKYVAIDNSQTRTDVLFKGRINGLTKFLGDFFADHVSREEQLLSEDLYGFVEEVLDEPEEKEDLFDYSDDGLADNEMPDFDFERGESESNILDDIAELAVLSDWVQTFLIGLVQYAYFVYILPYSAEYKQFLIACLLFFFLCLNAKIIGLIAIVLGFAWYMNPWKLNFIKYFVLHFSKKYIRQQRDYYRSRLAYYWNPRKFSPLVHSRGAAFFAIGASLLAMVMIYKKTRKKEHNTSESVFSKPVQHNLEERFGCGGVRERIKSKHCPEWNILTRDVPIGKHKSDAFSLMKVIGSNSRKVLVVHDDRELKTHILGIKKGYALINTHAFKGKDTVDILWSNDEDYSLRKGQKFKISLKQRVDLGNDLSVILTPLLFRDISSHFPSVPCDTKGTGYFANQKVFIENTGRKVYVTDSAGDYIITGSLSYKASHGSGDCGLPVCIDSGHSSSYIAGIHAAGGNNCGFSVPVSLGVIMPAIDQLKTKSPFMEVHSQSDPQYDTLPPIRKSPFMYEKFENLDYKGRIPGPVLVKGKSKLKESGFGTDMLSFLEKEFSYERQDFYGVPVMKPIMRDGEYISPYNIGMRKMDNAPPDIDPVLMERCILEYTDRIVDGLRANGVDTMNPLTSELAINGHPKDYYTRRIDPSKSAAHGFVGAKKNYLPEGSNGLRYMNEYLGERVVLAMENYLEDKAHGFIYDVQLKDEAREISRCREGKTRLFYMSPLDNLVLSRMFLSPFYTCMVEYGDIFCTAVGINMHTGATSFVERLLQNSNHIMELDYSGYDVANPLGIAHAAATVVEQTLIRMGYNDASMKIVRGLLTDGMFPVINLNNDLFVKPGLQTSGKYGTAEDNSLRGILMLMYCFYSVEEHLDKKFFEEITPCVYGDDLVAAVSDDCASTFNNIVYKDLCQLHYGMKVTPACKGNAFGTFVDVESMSFLRRTFSRDRVNGGWKAKLALDSIQKSVEWVLPSESVSPYLQYESCFASMLWELFFHCNNVDKFNKCRKFFRDRLKERYPECSPVLPTYDTIYCAIYQSHKLPVLEESKEGMITVGSESGELFSCENAAIENVLFYSNLIMASVGRYYSIKGHAKNYDKLIDLYEYKLELELEKEMLGISINIAHEHKGVPDRATRSRYRFLSNELEDVCTTIRVLEERYNFNPSVFSESEEKIDSIVENYKDFSGDGTDYTDAGPSMALSIGQEETTHIEEFLQRPVRVLEGRWNVGSYLDDQVSIWDAWSRIPAVRAKLRNFAYFRGNLHVRIAFSGMPFHQGQVLLSYQPSFSRNFALDAVTAAKTSGGTNFYPMYLCYLSQAPGAKTLNVRDNTPVEMILPFISTNVMFRNFNTSANILAANASMVDYSDAGALYVVSYNPLGSSAVGSTSVFYQVVAWAENVELGMNTATQIEVQSESDEKMTGPITRGFRDVVKLMDWLEYIPIIRPLSDPMKMIAEGIGGVSAHFGWSRPFIRETPSFLKNRPFSNSSVGIGLETSEPICVDPERSLALDGGACGTMTDDMVISRVTSTYSYIDTFEWLPSDEPFTSNLWLCKVHPQLDVYATDGLNNYFVQPSAMSFAATPFLYWRGDIEYRFKFVTNAFQRGKIMFFYEPNVHQANLINASISTNKQFLVVFDIQEGDTLEFTVEWAQPRGWCKVLGAGESISNMYNFDPDVASDGYVNGYIGVTVFTELQGNNDDPVFINVFARSRNLQLNQSASQHIPLNRDIFDVGVSESCELGVDCSDDDPMVINPTTSDCSYTSYYYFGEQPMSFRTLLKRYQTTDIRTLSSVSGGQCLRVTRPIFPAPAPTYGASTVYPNLFGYLRYAYLGMKGSMRKRVRPSPNISSSFMSRVGVTLAEPSDSQSSVIVGETLNPPYVRSGMALTDLIGTVQFVPGTNGGIEVDIPFYSDNLFVYSTADDLVGIQGDGDMDTLWSRNYVTTFEISEDVATEIRVVEETAIGEDFSFMRFQGAPYYSTEPF